MVKRHQKLMLVLFKAGDLIVAAMAWAIAYYLRYLGGRLGLTPHALPPFAHFAPGMVLSIILMFLDTGLRLSELVGIEIKDVDFDRETIKVMGKGARERVVRIGGATQKALLHYLLMRQDNYPCLWVSEEQKPLGSDGVKLMIKRLGERASIKGVRCSPHTFRHTFATRALLHGASEFEVQSLLGHEGLEMTRRYTASLRSEAAIKGHKRFSPVDNMGL